MVGEAAKHADEDKKGESGEKNNTNSLCFSIERLLKENGDKIDEEDKKGLEEGVKEVKELIRKR